jgi:nicotinamidase-related amidase
VTRIWDDVIPAQDRLILEKAGFGTVGGGGEQPALLVIDVTYAFVGDRPEPVLESIKRFPNSCGEIAWTAMEHIRELLTICRAQGIPVFYTKGMDERNAITRGAWSWKKDPSAEQAVGDSSIGNQIPDMIAPLPGETVIQKTKPSAFFGTPLASYLIHLAVDTVVVTGTTTSGCIRASVLDAFAHNFKSILPEEAVFDRSEVSHKVNCFDMNAKYADVLPMEDVKAYLKGLGSSI